MGSDCSPPSKTRVLLIQTIVPHYRVPVFERLSQLPEFDFCFAYGRERAGRLPKSELSLRAKKLFLTNYCFGPEGKYRFQAGVISRVLRREFDIIIAEFNPRILSNVVVLFLARLRRIPFVWWGHGMGHGRSEWVARMRTTLVRLSSALITYSDQGASRFVERGIGEERVFVACNAIYTSRIEHLVEQIGRKQRKWLLFVGRLVPERRLPILVSAFALLAEQFPELSLCIVGDGPEAATLRKMAGELGIRHRCVFPGSVYTEEELAPFFLSAHLFVSPGAIGLGLVHSLAYGLPVIVYRSAPHGPEIGYLRDGYNGLLFDSDNPAELAEFLSKVLRNCELLQSLAEGARNTARSISVDRMIEGFVSAINSACNRQRPVNEY